MSDHKPPQRGARQYPYCRPRCWKNKESGKLFKVLPWFQPMDNDSRIDFKGLLKEIEPEMFADDVMADFEVYSGLVIQVGWMLENVHRVWLGLIGIDMQGQFEDIGEWNEEEHRPQAGAPIESPP